MNRNTTVQVSIPSKFGFEKIVAECALSVAKEMDFQFSKLEDLKTAIIEACINAIEHGNKLNQKIQVHVTITSMQNALIIEVKDSGHEPIDISYEPDIKKKIDGEEKPRGWGLFLIKKLMDEVEVHSSSESGNVLTFKLYCHH
ncbi:MAG: ATP-binding protein [bacterium]